MKVQGARQIQRFTAWPWGIASLSKLTLKEVVNTGLTEKGTIEKNLERGGEGVSHMDIWRKK